MKEWKDAETDRSVSSFTMTDVPGIGKSVTIVHSMLGDKVKWTNEIVVSGDGLIEVKAQIIADKSLPPIPKIGMSLLIPDACKTITWFGKGPQENYIDRNSAAAAGLYSMDINQFITPYILPQENANRTDIRWMKFSDPGGKGLEVRANDLLSMSAWPWTKEQIESAKHTNELPVNDFITINIDLKQMGVGGNDSWSRRAFPMEKYQIKPATYEYSFKMIPVK
jgi:beta-galactosidase